MRWRGARASRLLAAPLAYVALWAAFTYFKHLTGEAFSGEEQLVRSDFSSSRFAIWADTLAMIARQPWLGVGWGEFNFAWTLTPFPDRPTAFFDHTHNLPLQLAAELGVPLALLVLALFAWSLWRAFAAAGAASGSQQRLTLRAAFMMVLMMALHSQLEYPLWYAYFLLPTAFAWGLCLGRPGASEAAVADAPPATGRGGSTLARPLWLASALLAAGGAAALYDYSRVVPIFSPGSDARPLAQRIAAGQRSLLFGHHADYAAATSEASSPAQALAASHRAVHYLLDSRLMEAWAKTFEATGDDARARYVAARLKEFRNDGNDAFFEPCREEEEEQAEEGVRSAGPADNGAAASQPAAVASGAAADAGVPTSTGAVGGSGANATAAGELPFQCLEPPAGLGWRDFR